MLAGSQAEVRLHMVRRGNRSGSSIAATNRTAVTGPIPGAIITRRHTSCDAAVVGEKIRGPAYAAKAASHSISEVAMGGLIGGVAVG